MSAHELELALRVSDRIRLLDGGRAPRGPSERIARSIDSIGCTTRSRGVGVRPRHGDLEWAYTARCSRFAAAVVRSPEDRVGVDAPRLRGAEREPGENPGLSRSGMQERPPSHALGANPGSDGQ